MFVSSIYLYNERQKIGYNLLSNQEINIRSNFVKLPKIIFLGWTENDPVHIQAVAALLNKLATAKDLLLLEYLDSGKKAVEGKRYINGDGSVNVLARLQQFGFHRKMAIEGWDNTLYGIEIGQMFLNIRPINHEILIGKRNKSLIKAIEDTYNSYERIWALAGTTHYCIPLSATFPLALKVDLSKHLHEYHSKLRNRFGKKAIIIVPQDIIIHQDPQSVRSILIPMLLIALMVYGIFAKFTS